MYQVKFTTAYKKAYKLIKNVGWLLIYLIEEDILTLTLIDTGSHSDLFKK